MPQSPPNAFDPYHRWLGIPASDQPPNYYRLLGIELFERDLDVIETAADRQMAHLKTYQIGKYSALSQKLLGEVAKARTCLLDAGRKLQYDEQLRREAALSPSQPSGPAAGAVRKPPPPPSSALAPMPTPADAPVVQIATGEQNPGHRAYRRKKQPGRWGPLMASAEFLKIVIGGAGGLAIAVVLLWIGFRSDPLGLFDPIVETPGDTQQPEAPGVPLPGRLVLDWPEAQRDQATLRLNGRPVSLPGGAVSVTPDSVVIEVHSGTHRLAITWAEGEPLEQMVHVASESPTRLAIARPPPASPPAPPIGSQGLLAHYFHDREFQKLAVTRVDPNIHFLWNLDPPTEEITGDTIAIRWEGFLKAPRPGRYTLAIDADDRMKVWIDGREVLNVSLTQQSAEVDLTDQPHGIRVEFEEDINEAHAVLTWSLPGVYVQHAIPAAALFTERDLAEQTVVPESVMRRVPSAPIVSARSTTPVDLLAMIDPIRDAPQGMWWFDNGSLLCSRRHNQPHGDEKFCKLSIPFTAPQAEYRLTVEVERCVGNDAFGNYLATERGRPYVAIDHDPLEGWGSGLYGVNGQFESPGKKLQRGKRHAIVYEVRRSGIAVSLDGTTLHEWKGDMAKLPETDQASRFVLQGYDTIFRIHKLTWEPLETSVQPIAAPPLAEAELLMTFEDDSIFAKDRKLYIRDLSGHQRHAEFAGGGVRLYNGVAGRAVNFNGTTRARLDQPIRDDFTISFWIQTAQPAKTGRRWYDGIGLIDADVEFFKNDFGVTLLNGRLTCGIGNPDTTLSATTLINDGKWRHCCVSRNSTSGAVSLYIDGRLEKNGTLTKGSRTVAQMALGEIQTGINRYVGLMDELAIYPRVLSESEIRSLYAHGKAGQKLSAPAPNVVTENDDQPVEDLPPIPDAVRNLAQYKGRSGENKAKLLKHYGGNEASEQAVARALAWLAKTQLPDGSWSFDQRAGGANSGGGAAANAQNGATALALLALLGAGQSHTEGIYKDTVDGGFRYLLNHGALDSHGLSFRDPNGTMYSHALATMALCEAYEMTDDADLYKPMRAAVSYTIYAQDPRGGGWRYAARQPGDTSVTGWQLASLRTYAATSPKAEDERPLKLAGVGANVFLNSVQEKAGANYGYREPGHALSTTAIGLTSRIYLGWTLDNPALQEGVAILDRAGPDLNDLYYAYYGTQVARHAGGGVWQRWNGRLRDPLVEKQTRTGAAAGSWYLGSDSTAVIAGGRHFCTTTAALVLESYYRDIPQHR